MTRPKDLRNKVNRQHRAILEERQELLNRLASCDEQKAREIEAAVAPLRAQLEERNEEASKFLDANHRLREQVEQLTADLAQEREAHGNSCATASQRILALEIQLDRVKPDFERLQELVTRWQVRARKDEAEEANALLNRKLMAAIVPAPRRS